MKTIQKSENKAFLLDRKPTTGSTQSVSYSPLFIVARGKERKIEENIKWKTRRVCLRYGERFRWKDRCGHCRYLISFQVRVN